MTDLQAELVNLYHLARAALDNPSRHDRMVWAAKQHSLHGMTITEGQAYSELHTALGVPHSAEYNGTGR